MKFISRLKLIGSCICYLTHFVNSTYAQVVIDQNYTSQQLVNKLLGPGIQVSNVSFIGSTDAIGFFDGTASNLGLDSGLVLSTGFAPDLSGPNNSDDMSGFLFTNGDADLSQLSGFTTFDATIIEFDFIPSASSIEFKYVFGSDEYNEFVCSEFNDVFGFFLSGPGINGQQNLALVPGSNLPMTINNINNGTPGAFASGAPCNLGNSFYFINNPPFNPNTTVELDGFTIVMTVQAQIPFPCQTYHIKLAIADAEDDLFDSAIFLLSGSFSSLPLASINSITNNFDSIVFEGCTMGQFIFELALPLNSDTTIYYNITGTAINGQDYFMISDSIIINSGATTASVLINPVSDNTTENPEFVTITLQVPYNCSNLNISDTIWIIDHIPIEVKITGDTSLCAGDPGQLTADIYGGTGLQSLQWMNGQNATTINIDSDSSQWYYVAVTDICGPVVTDSVFVKIHYPDCDIFIPNIITFNHDNKNDSFIIKNIESYPYSKLQIFNRWGNLIYETDNYQNEWNGRDVSDGVYFYILRLNNGKNYSGSITLIK